MVTGSKPKQFIDNLNNVCHEANRHFMNKNKDWKLKLMNWKLTVRPRISETSIWASLTLS